MLVLLTRGIYEVYRSDGIIWHDMHTKFRNNWAVHSSHIMVITATILGSVILVLRWKGPMMYFFEMW
jgi:hypothetical protein